MFIIMVLLAHATGEWVEISQQHYRKPLHNNYNFGDIATEVYFEETSKLNRIYDNQSVTEYVWNKGSVDKVPKLGSVQRVRLDTNIVKAPNIRGNHHDISESDEDQLQFKNTLQMPHEESQFQNTDRGVNSFNTELPSFEKKHVDRIHGSNYRNDEYENRFVTNSGFRNTGPGLRQKYKEESQLVITAPKRNNTHIYNKFVTNKDVFNIKTFDDYDVTTERYSTSSIDIFTNPTRIRNQENDNRNSNPISNINKPKLSAFSNKDHLENQANDKFISDREYQTDTPKQNFQYDRDATRIPVNPFNTLKEQTQSENLEEESNGTPGKKGTTMENLLQFMKVVADTIRKNTRRSVNSKTRYLQHLKDTILANIEERIDSAWPDDDDEVATTPGRQRRSSATARGHLEVPSSESALMTISFLTFAVFLIKLVLQVIQTYKNKTMMVTPTVVATVGRVVAGTRNERIFTP